MRCLIAIALFVSGCEPGRPASYSTVDLGNASPPGDGTSAGSSYEASSDPTSSTASTRGDTEPAKVERRTNNYYDRIGAPAGRADPDGNFYDGTGAPQGRVDSSGSYYDRTGAPAGRADSGGSFYDRTGAPAGRIDSSGNLYDGTGAPAGRIDSNGNVYDATGAPAGRVDGACDDACKRDAAAHVLLKQ